MTPAPDLDVTLDDHSDWQALQYSSYARETMQTDAIERVRNRRKSLQIFDEMQIFAFLRRALQMFAFGNVNISHLLEIS
jgi:hypothetical protein